MSLATSVFFKRFSSQTVINSQYIIKGLYDRKFDLLLQGRGGAEGHSITLICLSNDVDKVRHDDLIVVSGVKFSVIEIQPIEDGKLTKLILEETPIISLELNQNNKYSMGHLLYV